MSLRAQRSSRLAPTEYERASGTWLDPRRVTRSSYGADVAIAGMVPGVSSATRESDGGTFELWLSSHNSAAYVRYSPDYKQSSVQQSGPRDLWDEVAHAYRAWVEWGEPGRDRFGLTVTAEGQRVWVDEPGNPLQDG